MLTSRQDSLANIRTEAGTNRTTNETSVACLRFALKHARTCIQACCRIRAFISLWRRTRATKGGSSVENHLIRLSHQNHLNFEHLPHTFGCSFGLNRWRRHTLNDEQTQNQSILLYEQFTVNYVHFAWTIVWIRRKKNCVCLQRYSGNNVHLCTKNPGKKKSIWLLNRVSLPGWICWINKKRISKTRKCVGNWLKFTGKVREMTAF